ncbi:MAG: M56 family metallopeptidase [Nitriliruptoraceae bacterium]
MDLGVLLSLPVESIAIRVIVATMACVLLARLVLRAVVRSPAGRVAVAITPAIALLGVVAATSSQPRLPAVMVPVDARDALAIRVAEGYLYFAPIVFPLLVATWAVVVASRLVHRLVQVHRVHDRTRVAMVVADTPDHVRSAARHVARMLGVATPRVAVVRDAPGGAYVVGTRRPTIVVDAQLVARLDQDELEGVLAHELAHVRRRDNIVAAGLCTVRDAVFFAPGVGWAVRHLHRERELAADQVAVRATGRPAALASGLLKVLELDPRPQHACATLAPGGASVVDRVRVLVDAPTPVSPRRRFLEAFALVAVVVTSIVAALLLPTQFAGADRERDAVAIVWSPATTDVVATSSVAHAFAVYDRNSLALERASSTIGAARMDERSIENRRSTLRACTDEHAGCPAPSHDIGLGLRPRPVVTVDDDVVRSWHATPVVDGTEPASGLQMYWLARVN